MASVTDVIESISWDMSKDDLGNAFSYMERLGPHPSQNAIGFGSEMNGIPIAVIGYYQKKVFKEKLGAINIMIYEDPPPAEELEATYGMVFDQLVNAYGDPRVDKHMYSVWAIRGNVLQLSANERVLGLRYGNPKIDPPSAVAMPR